MLTHSNMLNAATSICQYLDLREDDVVLDFLPMAFDYGLYQMLMSVRQGARLILELSFQLPMQVLTHAAAERVGFFPGVPTVFAVLAQVGDVSKCLKSIIKRASRHEYWGAISGQAHQQSHENVSQRPHFFDVRPHRVQALHLSSARGLGTEAGERGDRHSQH
jgi:acyl-CoA synthetase (AMP-forming)/AMP-acid ligase II